MNYVNIIEKISIEGFTCVKYKGKSKYKNIHSGNFLFIRNHCEYEIDDIVIAEFDKKKYAIGLIKAKNLSHGFQIENLMGENLGWTTKIHGKITNILRDKNF